MAKKHIDAEKLESEIQNLIDLGYDKLQGNLYHVISLINSLQQEQLEGGLEEAAEEYSKRVSDGHNYRDLTCGFIAGAEWQEKQDLRWAGEIHKNGYNLCKEQMMKEAEECDLYYDGDFLAIDLNMAALGYSERDKVRVIVIPNTGKNEHGTY